MASQIPGGAVWTPLASLSPFILAELRYDFTGFFQPVDNAPTQNKVKAGSGRPMAQAPRRRAKCVTDAKVLELVVSAFLGAALALASGEQRGQTPA
jgi:hypothetical protein